MSTKNQREQLIHTATGQIAIIAMILIASWYYTIPQYMTLSKIISEINATISGFSAIEKNWLSFERINELLRWNKAKEELLGIIQSAPIETKKILEKTTSQPYLTWLNDEMESKTSENEKKNLSLKKARINSILPTFNAINKDATDESMNLRKYITFIENNIIHKFDLESGSPLGIQNIQYGKKNAIMPETIGSFDAEINFKATNANIAKMIDYINTLGRPDILINPDSVTGTGWAPGIMSNPLVTLDSTSLENSIDLTNPNDFNQGRISLKFYVRGSSLVDIGYIKEAIKNRNSILWKSIITTTEKCQSEPTCPHKKEFQVLSRKYNEFDRAIGSKNITGQAEIYALSSELDSISSLERELKNLTQK